MGLEQDVLEFIRKELVQGDDVELTPETDLIGEGHLDSFAMVELIVWVEETYKISVNVDDLTPATFGSAAKIGAYIRNNGGGAPPGGGT